MQWISLLGLLSCVPQILDCCIFICICFKVSFNFFLDLIVFPFIVYMLFSHFHDFVCSLVCLWLSSSFKALWSEKMLDMISIILNLLRFVLCPNMWSILQNVPCVLEEYVYFAALGWNALKISIKSIWSSVSFKAVVSLLIYCLKIYSLKSMGC